MNRLHCHRERKYCPYGNTATTENQKPVTTKRVAFVVVGHQWLNLLGIRSKRFYGRLKHVLYPVGEDD